MSRCTSCIMPHSVPGIAFDEGGVCSLCRDFSLPDRLGEDAFVEAISRKRRRSDSYDCIVPLSGGRDSTYVLYLAKAVYGLNPLAVNFDNEFRNPQALENMKTACDILGVDLKVVRSRRNLATRIARANTKAAASLGLADIMHSLCRHCTYGYVSAAYREAERNQVSAILWGTSSAESTERIQTNMWMGLTRPRWERLKSPNFYLTEYLCLRQRNEFPVDRNPRLSRRAPRLMNPNIQEIRVFDFLVWDRRRIKATIMGELGWVKPAGHRSTWRTDCLIHELVNFFFIKTIGCTKDCLGYCNMINEGHMTRAEAIAQENEALAGIRWENVSRVLEERIGLSRRDLVRIESLLEDSRFPES